MKRRSWIVASVLAVFAAASLVACSAGPSSQEAPSDSRTGTVGMALAAVGPDGATYTLSNVWMTLTPTSGGGAGGSLEFSNATGTQSFSVATGSYSAMLTGGPADGSPGWTLNRGANGSSTTVSAVLLDREPYAFAVNAGATTNLTLHFEVANVGNVIFSAGTLTTTLSVDAGTLPPGHSVIAGSATISPSTPTTANAAVNSLLSVGQTLQVPFAVGLMLVSPFQMSVDQACANVTASITATTQADAGPEGTYAAWFEEVNGAAPGQLCINDASSPFPNQVTLVIARSGAPTTPTFVAVNGSATNDEFGLSLSLIANPPYLSNGVLALGSLAQPVQLAFSYVILTATVADVFVEEVGGGSGTLQISP